MRPAFEEVRTTKGRKVTESCNRLFVIDHIFALRLGNVNDDFDGTAITALSATVECVAVDDANVRDELRSGLLAAAESVLLSDDGAGAAQRPLRQFGQGRDSGIRRGSVRRPCE